MAKNDDKCCGKTVTETTSTTTKYGMAACEPGRGTLQYIGARYVPVFANPAKWSRTRAYEHLMMVQYQGDTYISKQAVPVGIDLPTATGENDYWILMSNWNAQIEQYREEVRAFDGRITANADDIDALETRATTLENLLPKNKFTSTQTVQFKLDRKRDVKKKAILIGDSYLRTYTNNDGWGDYFAEYTGIECTKYKAGGAGFVRPGDSTGSEPEAGLNFVQMVQKAGQTMSVEERIQIDYVICQGIINDLQTEKAESDIQNAIHNFCQQARTYFANAKIVICFAICSKQYMFSRMLYRIMRNLNGTSRNGAQLVFTSTLWFNQLVDSYGRGDDIHPNNIGYAYLARLIARAINDSNASRQFDMPAANLRTLAEATMPDDYNSWFEIDDSSLIEYRNNSWFVNLRFNIKGTVPSTRKYFNIPVIFGSNAAANLFIENVYGVSGGLYLMTTNGVVTTDYADYSNIRCAVNPLFKDANGNNVNLAAGSQVIYRFMLPA